MPRRWLASFALGQCSGWKDASKDNGGVGCGYGGGGRENFASLGGGVDVNTIAWPWWC